MPDNLIEKDDIELIKEVLEGKKENYVLLIEKYKNVIFNLSLRFFKDKVEAEDIVQETFIKVYEHLTEYKISYKFSTWIYTIAINIIKNKLKRKKFAFLSLDNLFPTKNVESEEIPVQVSSSEDTEKEFLNLERKRLINSMIESLPEKYRYVFYLRFIENLPYNEISKIVRFPEGTVKTYLYRARNFLYKKFKNKLEAIS